MPFFFPSPETPEGDPGFVLCLGLIDSLVRYDSSDGDPQDLRESGPSDGRGRTIVIEEDQEVLIGAPALDYLSKRRRGAFIGTLSMAGVWTMPGWH